MTHTDNSRLYSIRLWDADTAEHEYLQRKIAERMRGDDHPKARSRALHAIFVEWIRNDAGIDAPVPHASTQPNTESIETLNQQIENLWQVVNGLLATPQAMQQRIAETGYEPPPADGISDDLLNSLMADFNREGM